MLTDEDIADRTALKALFEKRRVNKVTKAGFFHFEDQELMIAEGRETFVTVAHDVAVGLPLFLDGELDFWKFELAASLVSDVHAVPIETLWDVGANIGSICIPAVARGLVQQAVAFEPERRLFRLLRANAILNDVDSRIACFNVALGAAQGTASLTMSEGNTGDYRLAGRSFPDDSMGEAERAFEDVAMSTMDDYADEFSAGSTLIYMDIQGYEGIALKGATTILETAPPLVVEFWPYGMKRLESYGALREILCSAGYRRFADLSMARPAFETLSASALDGAYERLGEGTQEFTDLLVI